MSADISLLWNIPLFVMVLGIIWWALENLGVVLGWIWKLIAIAGARVMAFQHKRLVTAVVVGVVCVYVLSGRRYTVTRIANGAAYQVDNITGQAWILVGDQRKPVAEKD
jgi:hypothetical protein